MALVASGCTTAAIPPSATPSPTTTSPEPEASPQAQADSSKVTLAFAGDVHFEGQLSGLPRTPGASLGPIDAALADADLTMVNLESAIADPGRRDPKELEVPWRRYWFRTTPGALDVLDRAGVDVVTMANNHGADYGAAGVRDSLEAAQNGSIAVVGIGEDRRAAFTPHLASVNGTEIAILGADASRREGASSAWAAGPTNPGVAAARSSRPAALLAAVRAANKTADVVVVYLHWGREYDACPTARQRDIATALAEAGADAVVGSHTHVLQGAGWIDDTYVAYGLGNFVWYHNSRPVTGLLRLAFENGRVVSDRWVPARITRHGLPELRGERGSRAAVADWQRLRGCTGLAAEPRPAEEPAQEPAEPGFTATVSEIGPALARRMTTSHRPGCPLALRDLRHLRLTYVGFDGRDHVGELVVAARYANDVVGVFEQLYDARWPIRRMRLVDAYGGSDARSMAADNTSAYNCRRVADVGSWSMHALGAAVDLNPVENPYLTPGGVEPPAGRRYADIDRSPLAVVAPGVIREDDLVVRAFAAIGWEWGGNYSSPDYQHFAAPRP